MTVAERNLLRAALLVEELVRGGAVNFCVGPGARSTPIALAVARHVRAQSTVHTDERGLGFYALGLARATGRPSVVVTTSGTAVANLAPAVVEADQAQIPLVVVTADRPADLQGTGANQTIDQVKFFGSFVRQYAELPISDAGFSEPALLAAVDRALLRAMTGPRGPVHLNVPLREPLGFEVAASSSDPRLEAWLESGEPWTRAVVGQPTLSVPQVQGLADILSTTRRGLLVVGALDDEADRFAAVRLAGMLGWPVVADVTSGLRFGRRVPNLLAPVDLLLASGAFRALLRPDLVLQIGGPVVSRRVSEWIAETPTRHVGVRSSVRASDPCHTLSDLVVADLPEVSCELGRRVRPATDRAWVEEVVDAARAVRTILDPDRLDEPALARAVSLLGLPVFVGSSMPVRDLDEWGAVEGPPIAVGSNRGASGIDGTIASGLGWARALGGSAVLFLGDQALFHDQSSLVLARGTPHLVVVVNNGGGGIFSKLPVSRAGPVFETHFAHAHDRELGAVAQSAGLHHVAPTTLTGFAEAVLASRLRGDATLLEVRTDRHETAHLRDRLEAEAKALLERKLGRPTLVALNGEEARA